MSDLAVGVVPDLGAGGLHVNGRVGRVVELLQDVAVRRLRKNFLGLGDGALHAVGAGREHNLRAEGQQRNAPLEAHGLRHGEDDFVALDRGHKSQRDAGVAAGGLNEHGLAGGDLAGLLGGVDHGKADAVLHARSGVLAFQFDDDGCGQSGGHTVQPHQGGVANEFSYIRGNARHNDLLFRGHAARIACETNVGERCSLSGGKNARHRAHIGIGAGTRTVLATSTHTHSVDPTRPVWQDPVVGQFERAFTQGLNVVSQDVVYNALGGWQQTGYGKYGKLRSAFHFPTTATAATGMSLLTLDLLGLNRAAEKPVVGKETIRSRAKSRRLFLRHLRQSGMNRPTSRAPSKQHREVSTTCWKFTAKARVLFEQLMYGLKPVPFKPTHYPRAPWPMVPRKSAGGAGEREAR